MVLMKDGGGGSLEGMASGMSDLKDALAQGVTFTPEAADALKSGVRHYLHTVQGLMPDAHSLGQEPPIGETPAAKVFKPFLATIATDPVQGLIPVLKQMLQDGEDVLEAIDKSARSIQQSDESGAAGFGGLQG